MQLYRFHYSCYARKVQMVLDLLGLNYEVCEVPYGNRAELAMLTNGYIQVPVLVDDQDKVFFDSRVICKHLLASDRDAKLAPPLLADEIWSYSDWCDGPLEDVLFRIASPGISRQFKDPWEKALFVFIKERKFGAGCVEQWESQTKVLIDQAQNLLSPTLQILKKNPFIFGEHPTLADAALYGQFAMLKTSDPNLPCRIAPEIETWIIRMEAFEK